MKYLLILMFLTPQTWPVPGYISSSQHGPFDNILACEKAARQAEAIAMEIGASRVSSFCASTRDPAFRLK